MKTSHIAPKVKTGLPSTALWQNRCLALGAIQIIRCSRLKSPLLDASYLHLVFEPAFRHSQIAIWTDDDTDMPIGYAIWACLSDLTLKELIDNPAMALHLSEWAEGGTVCLVDFAAAPGRTSLVATALMDIFQGHEDLLYIKRRRFMTSLSSIDKATALRIIERIG